MKKVLWLLPALVWLGHCVYLIRMHVTHMGVMVPIVLCVLWCLWGWAPVRRWLRAHALHWRLTQLFMAGLALWLVSLVAFFVFIDHHTRLALSAQAPELIVVLGSSTPGAKPSPALTQRLLLGVQYAGQYPQAQVIVSGGVDFRQTISEARVMSDFMISHGIHAERIWLEDQSTSTYENLVFSGRLAMAHGGALTQRVLVVTSDFHTPRAALIARKVGWVQASLAGAPTPLYMRYNAWLREYFAYGAGWLAREF